MTETLTRRTSAQTERALRRERAEIPEKIDAASARVRDLVGDGHRDGDPALEEALRTVRELDARERTLPDLIADAVAERCAETVADLRERERTLLSEAEGLRHEATEAQRGLEEAERRAETARARVEAVEIRCDALGREALPFEDFARKARELEGRKRLRLLEDARADGLLLPLDLTEDSDL